MSDGGRRRPKWRAHFRRRLMFALSVSSANFQGVCQDPDDTIPVNGERIGGQFGSVGHDFIRVKITFCFCDGHGAENLTQEGAQVIGGRKAQQREDPVDIFRIIAGVFVHVGGEENAAGHSVRNALIVSDLIADGMRQGRGRLGDGHACHSGRQHKGFPVLL